MDLLYMEVLLRSEDIFHWKLYNVAEKKSSKVRYEGRKCSGQTHLSVIPLVSALPPLFPTSNYKEKKCLAFYSSEIHRLYIRTQFGLVMRLRLCISPCRQPNLQLPAHMGLCLAGRLWGNRLVKVLPFFIWMKLRAHLVQPFFFFK